MTIAVTTATIAENDLQQLCTRLVDREVCYTVSNLIHTLAQAHFSVSTGGDRDMASLMDQAYELARPIEDWESAAEEAGWKWDEAAEEFRLNDDPEGSGFENLWHGDRDDWQQLCSDMDIEPHQTEVYEHWLVTDWMGEKLRAEGERVDDDFAGMTVWARTTTGQAISMDYVIRQITKKLHDVKEAE
jgi:hypothetical protein